MQVNPKLPKGARLKQYCEIMFRNNLLGIQFAELWP